MFVPLSVNSPCEAQLDFLFYKAPKPLDWSTPRSLLISNLKNRFTFVAGRPYPHPISHVDLVLRFPHKKPLLRGMDLASSTLGYLHRCLFKGASLDTLLINLPGRFMNEERVWKQYEILNPLGYIETLSLKLSSAQALRVKEYFRLYQDSGQDQIYGALASNPLCGEGAGCSAFAVSVLEILGLVTEEIQHSWSRELRIPVELMTSQTRRARTGFLGFIFGQNPSWSQVAPSYHLQFWDPQKMYQWCVDKKKALQIENSPMESGLEFSTDAHSNHIVWDVRQKKLPPLDLPDLFTKIRPKIEMEIAARGHLWTDKKLDALIKK